MTTRRAFLQSAALAAPALLGARPKPSNRVTLAVIGCGYQATYDNVKTFLLDPRVQVTMACDPILRAPGYGYRAEKEAGRAVLKEKVDAFYGNHDCRMERDWRKVVDDPSIDAVLVTTPDHWHATVGIAAMRKGKHVYGQKPLALGISEGQAMARVTRETGVVFQVGSQQRSAAEFRVACEIVRNGPPATGRTTPSSPASTSRWCGASTRAPATACSRTGARITSTSSSGRSAWTRAAPSPWRT